MGSKSLLKLGYAWLALQGLLSLLAPKKVIGLATTGWRAGFENVGDLEPREWYVEMTRVLGVGMLVAGAVGFLSQGSDEPVVDESVVDETTDESSDDDPVQVNVD